MMVPRPRNKANKSLPQNLYFDSRRSTYRYRRPTDGKWFQFGTDRIKAIDAARLLNLEFMRGADLIGAVMGSSSESFAGFLDTYERDVLPPRELAKGTLGLYAVHFRRFRKQFEGKAVDQITIRMVAEMLDALTPRTANQCRALLIEIFNHAASKGLCPDNPAASTINRIEKKQRKRHTVEGLKAIREKSPAWLQNAIDLALITAQRRTDIFDMRFDGSREGYLYVVQKKTAKASDAAWIRFLITPELQAVISRCRDDVVSPYLVHRKPERRKQKQAQNKDHWTKVEERYLTRAFKEAREAANCYAGWKEEEMPGFHEVRALSLHLYKKSRKGWSENCWPCERGHDQKLPAGPRGNRLVRSNSGPEYQRNHRVVLRQFCAGFAQTQKSRSI